jgi:hypothetical protein
MANLNRREAISILGAGLASPALAFAQAPAKVDPYADAKRIAGEPPLPEQGSFTIAVLPDTQHYSEKFPRQFMAQTEWIVAQQQKRNIVSVLHLGDITNRNTPAEWDNAHAAMKLLDDRVPYFLCPGNHDYSDGGSCQDRTTRLASRFPVSRFKSKPTFGGTYDREPEKLENNFGLFTAGGRDFVVIALEFGPRRDVVRWANEIADKYSKREAILITHAFIYHDETRYDWKKHGTRQSWNPHVYQLAKVTDGDVMDGEELWKELVSRHENFILTLNGHVLGDGLGRVDVHDYSPTLGERNESPQNRFSLKLAPVKT